VARLKPAEFDERMTLVEHLDELRSRIVFSAIVLVLAVTFCFWQQDLLFDIANHPLPVVDDPSELPPGAEVFEDGRIKPVTFSPTEPFFVTLKLCFYGGLLLALPILLYQIYAFVLPAFSPQEKRLVLPFLLLAPFLFLGGVVFAYFVVLPAALNFLLGFNGDDLSILVRASEYYGFFMLTLISVGILFQIPIAVLAVCRLGITTPQVLAKNRRYAVLVIAVAAMLLPGTDPITMMISMLPLYLLFELSLVMAKAFGNPPSEAESEPAPPPDGSASARA
jgi:sec-independent protein translocase protein TatC